MMHERLNNISKRYPTPIPDYKGKI